MDLIFSIFFQTNLHNEDCWNFHLVSCPNPTATTDFKVLDVSYQKVLCHNGNQTIIISENGTSLECRTSEDAEAASCFYKTWIFWSFVILTYIGTIGFNVGNSISDAICFDVLGEANQMKYGNQRGKLLIKKNKTSKLKNNF